MKTKNQSPKKMVTTKVKSVKGIVNDTAITAAVKAKFLADSDINGIDLHITTVDGVVTIKGVVPNADMKRKAIDKASNTEGVKNVHSEITVKASK